VTIGDIKVYLEHLADNTGKYRYHTVSVHLLHNHGDCLLWWYV